jgi:hypothetical protein
MAKYVNMICVHPTRVHLAHALHRWWIFRTSSRRSRSPRSHRISLLWAASRHMCVLVFLCFVFYCLSVPLFPLIHLVLIIVVLRRTYSTAGMQGVTCVPNGACHPMKRVRQRASGGLGAVHAQRVKKRGMSTSQVRECQPGMGTKYVIIPAFDASRLNVRNRCYCVCPLT